MGVLVLYGSAEAVLYALLVILSEAQGSEQVARTTIYGTWVLPSAALVAGLVPAIVCDRIWLRVCGLGTELRLPPT